MILRVITTVAMLISSITSAFGGIRSNVSGDAAYIENTEDHTVICFYSYDYPNGVGGLQGDSRSAIVHPGQT